VFGEADLVAAKFVQRQVGDPVIIPEGHDDSWWFGWVQLDSAGLFGTFLGGAGVV
jgi:hypothetical protein